MAGSWPSVQVAPELRDVWPDTFPGVLFWETDVLPENAEMWGYYDQELAPRLAGVLQEIPLADMPGIGISRKALKAFGMNPGRTRISSEALYRRIRQGSAIYRINSVVDVNNIVSLETGLSLGSYDTAKVGSSVTLRIGQSGERYGAIGKADLSLENMPVLADAKGPFGTPCSDSRRAMITEATRTVMTVIYCFSGKDVAAEALKRAEEVFVRFGGARSIRSQLVE